MDRAAQLFDLLRTIESGRVTTYGELGRRCSLSPRTVGQLLHHNPNPSYYPCHRVVRSDGTLTIGYAFGGKKAQKQKLLLEGVSVTRNRVDLKRFGQAFFAQRAA